MPKLAVRTLIQLRRSLDAIEANLVDNRQRTVVASKDAIPQLNMAVGDERIVKFAGENWKVRREIEGFRVIALTVDEDI